jgi:hypothetical protein
MSYSTQGMTFRPVQQPAMGDVLTDWACESHAFAASWRTRLDDALVAGAIAAAVGGASAGVIGAVLKRPALGALIGATMGWAAHAVWTAPLVPSAAPPRP